MAEIGAVMGWNEDRVKNELYRARRSLAEWQRREKADELRAASLKNSCRHRTLSGREGSLANREEPESAPSNWAAILRGLVTASLR